MSAVSFTLVTSAQASRASDPGVGEQQLVKQQRDQDAARTQQLGAQLRQIFVKQAVSSAVANSQAADAAIEGAVSTARASASAAISSSSSARNARPHGEGDGGNIGLQNAANVVAG